MAKQEKSHAFTTAARNGVLENGNVVMLANATSTRVP